MPAGFFAITNDEAGKLMLQRIDLLLKQGKTFAIETTLATRSYATLVRRANERGDYWIKEETKEGAPILK